MKKRWFALFGSCLLLFSIGLSCVCYAGGSKQEGEIGQEAFGIYATYVGGVLEEYTAPVQDGSSELELPDGTVITVSDVADDLLTLVVYPIPVTDEDAWNWIVSCLAGKGSHPVPYEIYFLDGDGKRAATNGVSITITLPEAMKNPSVFSLGTDGNVTLLTAQVKDGKITFTADGRRYYVLAEKEEEVMPTVTGAPEVSGTPTTPVPPTITEVPITPVEPTITEPPVTPVEPTITEPPITPTDPTITEPPVTPIEPTITEPPVTPVGPTITEPPVTPVEPTITEPPTATVIPTITEPPTITETPTPTITVIPTGTVTPVNTEKPAGPNDPGGAGSQPVTNYDEQKPEPPKTGDETEIEGWFLMLAAAGISIIAFLICFKRN